MKENSSSQKANEKVEVPALNEKLDFIPSDMFVPPQRLVNRLENIRWLIGNLGIKNRRHPKFTGTVERLWVELRKYRR